MSALRSRLRGGIDGIGVGVLAVGLLAFVARLVYIFATPGFKPQHDAYHYDADAMYIANVHHYPPIYGHGGITAANSYRPPAYSVFLAIIYKIDHALSFLGLSRWDAARLVQAVLGAIAVIALALIARRLFDRRIALTVGVLAAVFPPMVYVSGSLYSESFFVPVVLLATLAIVEYHHRPRRSMLVLGALMTGLAALTRDYGVLLLIPFCVAVRPRGGFSWRGLRPAAALIVGAVLVISPWTIRNAIVLHAFVPVSTSAGNTLAGTYNNISRKARHFPGAWREPSRMREFHAIYKRDALKQAKENSDLQSATITYIGHHPGYPFVVAYWNTVRMLELQGLRRSEITAAIIGVPRGAADVGVYVLWLAVILALGGLLTRRIRRGPKWIWLVPALMYLGVVFVQSETPRFRSPLDPFLLLLASAALVWVWEAVEVRRGRPAVRARPQTEPA